VPLVLSVLHGGSQPQPFATIYGSAVDAGAGRNAVLAVITVLGVVLLFAYGYEEYETPTLADIEDEDEA
jgi:hypothetical protein